MANNYPSKKLSDERENTTGITFGRASYLASGCVAILAIAGLLGHMLGLRTLGSIAQDYVPMAPTTAICFLIFSVILFRHSRTPLHGSNLITMTAPVIFGTVFCLLEFAELFVGMDLNMSDTLFPPTGMVGTIPVGRMSPATAASFFICGLGILLLLAQSRRTRNSKRLGSWASGMGLLTMLIGATVLLGYLYGTPFMYGGGTIPMAATTALAFMFLGLALITATGPDTPPMCKVTGHSTSAVLSRVFIPLVVAAVMLQGLLSRYVSASSLINEVLIMALLLVITGMITAVVVERVANLAGKNVDEVNRKLHLTLQELQESAEHHRDILHTAMDGIILVGPEGRLEEVNESYCRMSGYSVQELQTMSIANLVVADSADVVTPRLRNIMELGETRYESKHRRKDGSSYDLEVNVKFRPAKGGHFVFFVRDISERKLRETAHLQAGNLLQLASSHSDLHECMSALTASLQNWSGCEAVGIRLRAGDDYPYFETSGFPATFIQAENQLCAYDSDGKILRDGKGNPVLECMCGNILCGRFDPAKPFFTTRGSFWSNNTTALLASTTEADRQARTRNRCNSEGYESVALVPMHAGDQIIGLMQFNDHRSDRFTPILIDIFEGMADKVALALTRRHAENELRKTEKIHHDLLNAIPDLIWLKNADGVYLSCNATFERFYGAKKADIIGKTDYDFVDTELADFFRDHDRKAIAAAKPSHNEEWVTFADDGHRALLYTTKMPMYDSDGTLAGVLGVGRDITELNQAEETLRESENRLRYALEGTNDGLWDVQLHSGRTYMSPRGCEILGYREDEVTELTKHWSNLVYPDDMQVTEERLQAHLDGKAPIFEVEQRLRTKSGDWKWIYTRGKVVERDQDGVPLRITGTHSDITEKKKIESQLHQAQKMESVGSLAGGVAHDFNNKLSVILGHTYLALTESIPEQVRDSLEEIRKAAEQSADLTRQLLAFARKQTIAPKVLDLNETVIGMLKMLNRLVGEDIRLSWQPAADLWLIRLDPSQIDQILANLCVNARDSITDGGTITIETGNSTIDEEYCARYVGALPGEYVRIVVSDNGCGMDNETSEHIFEPFFTTKETGKGTGLGLATIFGIVKQNSGFINVYSEPGMGTTFTIYLPRHLGASERSQREGSAIPAPRGQETILLVEDELAILNMATLILTRQGYNVLQANTTTEAIRIAQGHTAEISLLVTDVIMPEMNGKELADTLRSRNPQLRSLFMSGYTADVIAQHGVLDEGVSFIQKPFSLPDLAAKVREVLDT